MAAYILRRLWQMVPTILGVVLLVFFLFSGHGLLVSREDVRHLGEQACLHARCAVH